jgi:hypothetical protein
MRWHLLRHRCHINVTKLTAADIDGVCMRACCAATVETIGR